MDCLLSQLDLIFLIAGCLDGIDVTAWSKVSKGFRVQIRKIIPRLKEQLKTKWLIQLKDWYAREELYTGYAGCFESEADNQGELERCKTEIPLYRTKNKEKHLLTEQSLPYLPEWQAFQTAYREYPSAFANLITKEEMEERIKQCQAREFEVSIPVLWAVHTCNGERAEPSSTPWKDIENCWRTVLWYLPTLREYVVTQDWWDSNEEEKDSEQYLYFRPYTKPLTRKPLKQSYKDYITIFRLDRYIARNYKTFETVKGKLFHVAGGDRSFDFTQGVKLFLRRCYLYRLYRLPRPVCNQLIYDAYVEWQVEYDFPRTGKNKGLFWQKVKAIYHLMTPHWIKYLKRFA